MKALEQEFSWQLLGESAPYSGVAIDARRVRPGQLFVALKGERFDGHDYVVDAFSAGAAGALVSRPLAGVRPLLIAADTQRALGDLAELHRRSWRGSLLAVTGSAGKTTTKEMLAGILGLSAEVNATRGNYNNEIGVPLTLLQLRAEHDYAVVEMGAAKPGDIAYLVAMARPRVSIITNALPAHLQGFGGLAQVAQTKGEIFGDTTDHFSVINLDDHFGDAWYARARGSRILGYSAAGNPEAAVTASQVQTGPAGSDFTLDTPLGACRVQLHVPGSHAISNALAAAAGALAVGSSLDDIRRGLEQFDGVQGRLQPRRSGSGLLVIDDSYNANPEAACSALDVLAMQEGPGIFILGDMAELGETAEELHRRVGIHARNSGVEQLVSVGELAACAAVAFGSSARSFATQDDLLAWLGEDPPAERYKTCLVKGSRSAHMENIVHYLLETAPQVDAGPGGAH